MIYVSPFEYENEYIFQHPDYYRINESEYKMNINGTGSVMVEPNIANVSLGVITTNKDLKASQQENAIKSTKVITSIINMGVKEKDIRTESYTINPEYDYIEGKQIFRDYKVTHMLQITVRDLKKVGEIIDTAVSNGANTVNTITFTLADPAPYYMTALNLAIADSVRKAKSIEDKLAIEVNKIPISITEESQRYNPPVPRMAYAVSAETHTPIEGGQLEISANVKVIFTYWTRTP